MNRFLLILVGSSDFIHRQAVFAILSILAHTKDEEEVSIHVITDHSEWYTWIGDRIHLEHVDEKTLRDWRGPHDYFWRLKLSAMQHIHDSFSGGNLIYIDSDVVVRDELESLFTLLQQGSCFMHKKESDLIQGGPTSFRRKSKRIVQGEYGGLQVGEDSAMWNAGVVAIPDSLCARYLEAAIQCCDELCRIGTMRKGMEQLSFSLSLAQEGRLQSAEHWFIHFWGNKPAWNALIATFLAETFLKGESISDASKRLASLDLDMSVGTRRTRFERLINSARKRFRRRDHLIDTLVNQQLTR